MTLSPNRGAQVLILAALLAGAAACGNGPCGPSNCGGCCDDLGWCHAGNTFLDCGLRGVACQACAPGQSCTNNACADASADCGPNSCAGCCSGGTCSPGNGADACGINGAACQTCPAGQSCGLAGACIPAALDGGGCGPASCNGCCSGDSCLGGFAPSACGAGGAACAACASGQSCISGACLSSSTDAGACNATNCPGGCCNGGACVALSAETPAACGFGGASCRGCASGQQCYYGSCADAGTCGVCDGCCSGATCVALSQETNASCGRGAVACSSCTASAEYCGLGTHACGGAGAGAVGAACSKDTDCRIGHNAGSPWCFGWPGGYCVDTCDTMASHIGPCGAGQWCLPILAGLGNNDWEGVCLAHCATSADCPPGDVCDLMVGDGSGHCVPRCHTAGDCGQFFGDPNGDCDATTGLCCGILNFRCCGGGCRDASICQSNGRCE